MSMLEIVTVPAVVLFVEAFKKAGMPTRYAPVVAILVGVAIGYGIGSVATGLLVGLSASGLYSGARAILK